MKLYMCGWCGQPTNQDGDPLPRTKVIKHAMSTDCRHPERATDAGCVGCVWIGK